MQTSSIAEVVLPAGVVVLELDVVGPGGTTTTHKHPFSIFVNEQPAGASRHLMSEVAPTDLPGLSSAQAQLYGRFVQEQKLDNVLQFIHIWASKSCKKVWNFHSSLSDD